MIPPSPGLQSRLMNSKPNADSSKTFNLIEKLGEVEAAWRHIIGAFCLRRRKKEKLFKCVFIFLMKQEG